MPNATYQKNLKIYGNADPRTDKTRDHPYWETLLNICGTVRPFYDIYWNLHGFRCGGAEIVLTKTSLKIVGGDWAGDLWAEKKQKYLEPDREKIVEALKMARDMTPAKERAGDE